MFRPCKSTKIHWFWVETDIHDHQGESESHWEPNPVDLFEKVFKAELYIF